MHTALALLLFTTAAQAQWLVQQSNSTADLRGIHALGNGVAWASGSKGTVLRTIDQGKTWQRCAVPPGAEALDFRGVQAFDEQTAIVMSSGKGELSRLYKTVDGCRNWKLLFTNPDQEGFWDTISLGRTDTGDVFGWLLGDPVDQRFTVFFISDRAPQAGHAATFEATRDETFSLAANGEVSGAFAASNSSLFQFPSRSGSEVLFVTGGLAGSRIYRRLPTSEGDVTLPLSWESKPLPLGTMTTPSGAFSIAFRSRGEGVAVGGDYTKPDSSKGAAAYMKSSLIGSWAPAQTGPHGYRSAVAPVPGENGTWITVGPNGTDLSTDDGRNWHPLNPSADESQHWNALSLPFVVGPHGRIGRLKPDALTSAGGQP